MKIITGELKHRKLFIPRQRDKVRMSTGVVKEAIIDKFRGIIDGSRMLDVFAGSGAVGIEFLSNNCEKAVFIDESHQNTDIIKRNLSKLNVETRKYEIINRDFRVALAYLEDIYKDYFDFVFIDPPYFKEYTKDTLVLLGDCHICRADAVIITEHHKKERVDDVIGRFKKWDMRKYGSTVLNFWKVVNV